MSDINKIVKEAEAWLVIDEKDQNGGCPWPNKLIRSLLAVVEEFKQELALDGEPYTDREKHLKRISELEQELAEAAQEINCAGTVAHRIRILKKEHREQFSAKDAEIAELKGSYGALQDARDVIDAIEIERDALKAALDKSVRLLDEVFLDSSEFPHWNEARDAVLKQARAVLGVDSA